jgi:hypothetical protein
VGEGNSVGMLNSWIRKSMEIRKHSISRDPVGRIKEMQA